MPYAYGVTAYASKVAIPPDGETKISLTPNAATAANPYGYVIPWGGMQSVKLVSQLLQKGIKLRYNEGAI